MGKINYGRVITGGLLAGVVINVGELILNLWVVADQWHMFSEEHMFPDPSSTGMAIMFILINFLFGWSLVLLYALMRARCGAGPKTAWQAGFFLWFTVWFLGYGGVSVTLGVPAGLLITSLIWGLVEIVLAALAGGWAYREEAPQAPATVE